MRSSESRPVQRPPAHDAVPAGGGLVVGTTDEADSDDASDVRPARLTLAEAFLETNSDLGDRFLGQHKKSVREFSQLLGAKSATAGLAAQFAKMSGVANAVGMFKPAIDYAKAAGLPGVVGLLGPAIEDAKASGLLDAYRRFAPAVDGAKAAGLPGVVGLLGPAIEDAKASGLLDAYRRFAPAVDYAGISGLATTIGRFRPAIDYAKAAGLPNAIGLLDAYRRFAPAIDDAQIARHGLGGTLERLPTSDKTGAMVLAAEHTRFAEFVDALSAFDRTSSSEDLAYKPPPDSQVERNSGLTVVDSETLGFFESLLFQLRLCLPSIERAQQVTNVTSVAGLLLITSMVLRVGYPEIWKAIVDNNGMISLYLAILILVGQTRRH
ncbi:MAG: hypothetical protein HOV77_34145 [Hamadaea sp.]|uniref:hypothetical protein n=1 Tax=Hamadaea sp. TaxID=2024425 RepID=UPI00183991EC|nr:hypothetical protein [Hamadaea sp.]NUT24223.1 hypothetical protein [Hamadaea sp.]